MKYGSFTSALNVRGRGRKSENHSARILERRKYSRWMRAKHRLPLFDSERNEGIFIDNNIIVA